MLLSAVSVLVVAQSSSEIPEGLMNNPVLTDLLEELGAYLFIDPEERGTILVQKSVNIYKVTLCNISEVLELPLADL